MKVTLSRKQWELIGKKAGWMQKAYDEYDAWDELYGTDTDDGFDAMRDFGGDIDEARRNMEEKTSISPKKEVYESPESPFQKYLGWGKKLPPELAEEKKRQDNMMTDALVDNLGMRKSDITGEVIISPWSEVDDNYDSRKAEALLMEGAREGKWDEYLAKRYLSEMSRTYDALIR